MWRFAKYHGLGNDFVLLDRRDEGARLSPAVVRWLCDRHRGVGADGVLTVWPAARAVARMQVQNADGSDAGMCGNGLRCVARFLYDVGAVRAEQPQLTLQVGDALYPCRRLAVDRYEVHMGQPSTAGLPTGGGAPGFAADELALQIGAADEPFRGTLVGFGNPHFVVLGDAAPRPLAERYGAALECHPAFADRANISFVRPAGGGFEAVVYERGVGITQACGSGACAVAVAAVRRGAWQAGEAMDVRLPGGTLRIVVDAGGSVSMQGEAVRVFEGQLQPPAALEARA